MPKILSIYELGPAENREANEEFGDTLTKIREKRTIKNIEPGIE
ncbi:MAG: hypothetical protein H6Q52_201 [Deltaproteobacteria bacterium]|nr:hypothetical protein [Deltaproteobacteria bacterium]